MRAIKPAVLAAFTTACLAPSQALAAPQSVTVCPSGPPACDVSSISDALAAVATDGRVAIAPGNYAGGFAITRNVTISGAGAGGTHVTGAPVSVAAGAAVVIRSLTIEGSGGEQTQLVNEGSLTLRDSVVTAEPDLIGTFVPVGAILNNGSLTAHRTRISGRAHQVGGLLNNGEASLIYSRVSDSSGNVGGVENVGRLLVQHSEIVDNHAGFDGGIRNEGDLVVRDSKINDNGGQGPGGIINTGDAVVVDTELRRNQLTGVINTGDLTLRRVLISGWGTGVGNARGGLYNQPTGSVVLADSTIDGADVSTLSYQHPAVDNAGAMTITASQLRNARNSFSGGAITNDGTLTLRNTSIVSSHSDENGGGIFNAGSLTMRQSQISSSSANGSGGGIFNQGIALLTGSTLTGNSALDLPGSGTLGGGVANVPPGAFTAHSSAISGNAPDNCAGC
jgi:hypothetical protein